MPIRLKYKWHYPNCVARNRAPPSPGAQWRVPDIARRRIRTARMAATIAARYSGGPKKLRRIAGNMERIFINHPTTLRRREGAGNPRCLQPSAKPDLVISLTGGKKFLYPGRRRLARRPISPLLELMGVVGTLQIDFTGANAERPRLGDKSCGGVDRSGSTYSDEGVSLVHGGINRVHMERHLPKPNNVRAEPIRLSTGWAPIEPAEILPPRAYAFTSDAARLEQFTMHMDHMHRTGALMKVVDILGDERQMTSALGQSCLQSGKSEVRRIGLRAHQVPATSVVERVHLIRIAGESLRRRKPHWIELRPYASAVLVAESAKTTFSGDACAGEHENPPAIHFVVRSLWAVRERTRSSIRICGASIAAGDIERRRLRTGADAQMATDCANSQATIKLE